MTGQCDMNGQIEILVKYGFGTAKQIIEFVVERH